MSAEPTPSVVGEDGREDRARARHKAARGLYDGRHWRTSTHTSSAGQCVEAAPAGAGSVLVRDSRNRRAAHLSFGGGEWTAFLAWAGGAVAPGREGR
ncbi:DUF397 domain-containing protein [Nocardiopsis endophytica]|uniref:DUF397 domain-containing protein n=1 Tax=Nocardiopsis endophytica TaxID=3018445 RepID=UPI002FDB7D71